MGLRLKIVGIVTFGFLTLSATVFLYTRKYVEKSFTDFETRMVESTSKIIHDAYRAEFAALVRYAEEFARQPVVGRLVGDEWEAPAPAGAGLAPGDLLDQRISFFAVIDNLGEVALAKQIDPETGEFGPPPPPVLSFIGKDNYLRVHHHAESVVDGLVLIDEAPILTVSVPILPERAGGLIRGAVIVGREWAQSDFVKLSYRNGMTVFHQKIDGPLSADMKTYHDQARADGGKPSTRLLGDKSVATYSKMADIYGRPALIVRLAKGREAAAEALECSIRVAVFSLSAGLVLFIFMMALLEATVLHRLRTLVRQTKELKSADRLADVAITVRGRDEAGKIAHGLRYVLDAMKANKYRWMRAEKRLQELLELSPMGILLAEPVNQRLYRINDAALKIIGRQRGELIGKRISYLFVSIDGKRDFDTLDDLLDDEIKQVPAVVIKGDGSEMKVNVKTGKMCQSEGELIIFAFVPVNGDEHEYEIK